MLADVPAAELVASGPGLALATAVELPRVARGVVAVAVELDGEAMGGPAAVDASAVGATIGFRQREAGLTQDGEESALEGRQGDVRVAVEDAAKVLRARCVGTVFEDGVDLGGRRPVADSGLVAGSSGGLRRRGRRRGRRGCAGRW